MGDSHCCGPIRTGTALGQDHHGIACKQNQLQLSHTAYRQHRQDSGHRHHRAGRSLQGKGFGTVQQRSR